MGKQANSSGSSPDTASWLHPRLHVVLRHDPRERFGEGCLRNLAHGHPGDALATAHVGIATCTYLILRQLLANTYSCAILRHNIYGSTLLLILSAYSLVWATCAEVQLTTHLHVSTSPDGAVLRIMLGHRREMRRNLLVCGTYSEIYGKSADIRGTTKTQFQACGWVPSRSGRMGHKRFASK